MCKSWCELIIGLVILLFALWHTTYSNVIIAIAAIILVIHSFTCKSCFVEHKNEVKVPVKKKRR